LSFRIALLRLATKRQSNIFGRFYNRIAGEDPTYTLLSGTHLKQTLAEAKVQTPEGIKNTGDYKLRFDVIEKAMENLECAAKTATPLS